MSAIDVLWFYMKKIGGVYHPPITGRVANEFWRTEAEIQRIERE